MKIKLIEELTQEQEQQLKHSKVRNDFGDLLVVYGPRNGKGVTWYSSIRLDDKQEEFYLNCNTIFDIDNVEADMFIIDGGKVKLSPQCRQILERLDITEKLFVKIFELELRQPGALKYSVKSIVSTLEFTDLLRRSGYDCIRVIYDDYDDFGVFNSDRALALNNSIKGDN